MAIFRVYAGADGQSHFEDVRPSAVDIEIGDGTTHP